MSQGLSYVKAVERIVDYPQFQCDALTPFVTLLQEPELRRIFSGITQDPMLFILQITQERKSRQLGMMEKEGIIRR
jgi:hypothetical protein